MMAFTSQEKKVLGFIVIMMGLGLVMQAIKRVNAPKPQVGDPVPTVLMNTGKTH